jgi:2',3'-cyclic-nucleotide 2'-phosphodiesterase (5'-nucleotidase family)
MKPSIVILLLSLTLYATCSYVTVAIIGTNDLHGSAFPIMMQRQDTGERYQYGGLTIMGQLISFIRSEYPGNTLYLDAGDQFQGGI